MFKYELPDYRALWRFARGDAKTRPDESRQRSAMSSQSAVKHDLSTGTLNFRALALPWNYKDSTNSEALSFAMVRVGGDQLRWSPFYIT